MKNMRDKNDGLGTGVQIVLPSEEPGENSKEIDLGIVSTTGHITLIEIKDCEKPPELSQAI